MCGRAAASCNEHALCWSNLCPHCGQPLVAVEGLATEGSKEGSKQSRKEEPQKDCKKEGMMMDGIKRGKSILQ